MQNTVFIVAFDVCEAATDEAGRSLFISRQGDYDTILFKKRQTLPGRHRCQWTLGQSKYFFAASQCACISIPPIPMGACHTVRIERGALCCIWRHIAGGMWHSGRIVHGILRWRRHPVSIVRWHSRASHVRCRHLNLRAWVKPRIIDHEIRGRGRDVGDVKTVWAIHIGSRWFHKRHFRFLPFV